jgi:hypothetical protein
MEELTADEVAYRIGVAGATRPTANGAPTASAAIDVAATIAPTSPDAPGVAGGMAPISSGVPVGASRTVPDLATRIERVRARVPLPAGPVAPALVADPTPAARRPEPRAVLIRDTGAALAGLAAIVLLGIAVWPASPRGAVLEATGAPSRAPLVEPTPTADPTPAPSPTPEATPQS